MYEEKRWQKCDALWIIRAHMRCSTTHRATKRTCVTFNGWFAAYITAGNRSHWINKVRVISWTFRKAIIRDSFSLTGGQIESEEHLDEGKKAEKIKVMNKSYETWKESYLFRISLFHANSDAQRIAPRMIHRNPSLYEARHASVLSTGSGNYFAKVSHDLAMGEQTIDRFAIPYTFQATRPSRHFRIDHNIEQKSDFR